MGNGIGWAGMAKLGGSQGYLVKVPLRARDEWGIRALGSKSSGGVGRSDKGLGEGVPSGNWWCVHHQLFLAGQS